MGQQWSVTDLLWGLWISSLVLGYGYIFISMFVSYFRLNRNALVQEENRRTDVLAPGIAFNLMLFLFIFFLSGFSWYSLIMFLILLSSLVVSLNEETKKKWRIDFIPHFPLPISLLLLSIPMALFTLSFFTVHFVGFHLAHSMILNEFFPLVERVESEDGFRDFIEYVKNILQISIKRYWVFIGFSALSRLKLYGYASEVPSGSFFMPYKNVLRMHITIILIAIMNMYQISNYVLYVVFIIYFLPVGDLVRQVFPKKPKIHSTSPNGILVKMAKNIIQTLQKKIMK